jgi:predicted small lipoprotein YifL
LRAATGVGLCGPLTLPPGAEPEPDAEPEPEADPEQQLQVQGGQVVFAAHAGQAHAQPPPLLPVPPPASDGGLIRMHDPDGHGVVKQAMPSWTQVQASAESDVHEAASVCAVQGSAGGVAQSQGAQAAPSGQAGQTHTRGALAVPEDPPTASAAPPPTVLPAGMVVVMVVIAPQAQLQAGQA